MFMCFFVCLFVCLFLFCPENTDSFPCFEESTFSYKISLTKSSDSGKNNICTQA